MLVSRAACALRPNRSLYHSRTRVCGLHGLLQTLHRDSASRPVRSLAGSLWRTPARCASDFARALPTNPGQRLVASGSCGVFTILSNYESEVANVHASRDGAPIPLENGLLEDPESAFTPRHSSHGRAAACATSPCAPRTALPQDAARVSVDDDGNITIVSTDASSSLEIDVPAMFDVSAKFDGRCDVTVGGWIEGTVHVAVKEGDVSVNTVRGMQTSVRTGHGNIAVKTVEGNLDVKTGKGKISLGKILGEIVHACTDGGDVDTNAIYAKNARISATGALRVQVLSADRSQLDVGNGSVLSSVDGTAEVVLRGGNVKVEAANTLRSLQLRAESNSGHAQPGTVNIYVPKEYVAEAQVVASRLTADEALCMQERSNTAAESGQMRVVAFGPPEADSTATTPCSITIQAPEHLVSFGVMDLFRKLKSGK